MCDPVIATVGATLLVAVASGSYGAYETRQQRKEAEQQADEQAADAERTRKAQEALMASRKANLKYKDQADYELAGTSATDGTTSFNGLDAFRINPSVMPAPSALNVPGGQ